MTPSRLGRLLGRAEAALEVTEKLNGSRDDPSRVAATEDAILTSTVRLLGEIGYDRLRMSDIASSARVSLATIYRSWPTKIDLVVSAMQRFADQEWEEPRRDRPPTDDYEAALHGLVQSLRGPARDLIPGMVSAVRHNSELGVAFRTSVVERARGRARRVLDELAPDLDESARYVIADAGAALVLFRSVFAGEDVGDDLVTDVMEHLILPAITRSR